MVVLKDNTGTKNCYKILVFKRENVIIFGRWE